MKKSVIAKSLVACLALVSLVGGILVMSSLTRTPVETSSRSLIESIEWGDASTIVRLAQGSDNWPLTAGDDGYLYTAYGDGWGFEPRTEKKLSIGVGRVSGPPTAPKGENLRSSSIEREGNDVSGPKASGILMLDGVLYLLLRNVENATIAYSGDRGRTWTWSDWNFTESFGHPAFLNFGPNYSGARDEYVYILSHDNDSAYDPADDMVLARAPAKSILDEEAYEVFAGFDVGGEPIWSSNFRDRESILHHDNRAWRSSFSYNEPLDRFLMCQVLPGKQGLALFEAVEPWGPWENIYYSSRWDVEAGENCHIPTQWISDDGLDFFLVFSGDDTFAVRSARFNLRNAAPRE